MAKITLRIIGLPMTQDALEESSIDARNMRDVIRQIEYRYPRDYYTYIILLNGARIEDESLDLREGDQVVVVPVMSGG